MRTVYGLDMLCQARRILNSADRGIRERLSDAADAYWQAMQFYTCWPQALQVATEPIHRVLLRKPGIAPSIAAMTDAEAYAAADLLSRFVTHAKTLAAEADGDHPLSRTRDPRPQRLTSP